MIQKIICALNKRKRPLITYTAADESDEESAPGFSRLEEKLAKVDDISSPQQQLMFSFSLQMNSDFTRFFEKHEQVKKFETDKSSIVGVLECKICKAIPRGCKVMLLCCNQIIGCQGCFSQWMRENPACPLCRAENPRSTVINGLDPLYDFFSTQTYTDCSDSTIIHTLLRIWYMVKSAQGISAYHITRQARAYRSLCIAQIRGVSGLLLF